MLAGRSPRRCTCSPSQPLPACASAPTTNHPRCTYRASACRDCALWRHGQRRWQIAHLPVRFQPLRASIPVLPRPPTFRTASRDPVNDNFSPGTARLGWVTSLNSRCAACAAACRAHSTNCRTSVSAASLPLSSSTFATALRHLDDQRRAVLRPTINFRRICSACRNCISPSL